MILGLDTTEVSEELEAFWVKLPKEQIEPRIIDFVPHEASENFDLTMQEA